MDLLSKEIYPLNNIETEVQNKLQNKNLDNNSVDKKKSEIKVIKKFSKKRKHPKDKHHFAKRSRRKEEESDKSQKPCIINIKSPEVPENDTQKNCNGTSDSLDEMTNHSLQSSIFESTFASNVYLVLLDIQSTLAGIKAELGENTKKIDQLQQCILQEKSVSEEKLIPKRKFLPWAWKNVKNDFTFPISTNEKLLEFERKLEDKETANKLFVDLTNKTYASWKEMVLLCLKYMLSRDVAVLYNLNGKKGSKKKFRDLHICSILVGSVSQKYKEADVPDILKRISFILAGAGDWNGLRTKKYQQRKA